MCLPACLGITDAASVVFVDYVDGGAEVNSEGKNLHADFSPF